MPWRSDAAVYMQEPPDCRWLIYPLLFPQLYTRSSLIFAGVDLLVAGVLWDP